MKNRMLSFGWPTLGLAVAMLVVSVKAQQKLTTSTEAATETLNQAVALLDQGKPQEARGIIATIGKTNANYGAAKLYDALCLYQLNEKSQFLKALETSDLTSSDISPALREDLEFKQIDAIFYCRQFDDLFPKIENFQKAHDRSAKADALKEYQLAGLFERGMKRTYQACSSKNTSEYNKHWNVGKTNLEAFISLAGRFEGTNYQGLQKRTLKEEIWLARMTLGEEASVLSEIPEQGAADRERVGLLGAQLFNRLQPAEVDQNLRRMEKFISDFPASKSRKRVEFDMANISFSKGEALSKEADIAEQSGDVNTAASKRAQASGYFNYTRTLRDQMVVDTAAGIENSDVLDRQDDLLHSYIIEKNYDKVLSLASVMIQESKPGELRWMMGKDYRGIALQMRTPPDFKQAASELEEVLALNFKNKADFDRQMLVAAKWRIYAANRSGDSAKAVQLVQWVQDSNCTTNQKTAFLKNYSVFLASPKSSAK